VVKLIRKATLIIVFTFSFISGLCLYNIANTTKVIKTDKLVLLSANNKIKSNESSIICLDNNQKIRINGLSFDYTVTNHFVSDYALLLLKNIEVDNRRIECYKNQLINTGLIDKVNITIVQTNGRNTLKTNLIWKSDHEGLIINEIIIGDFQHVDKELLRKKLSKQGLYKGHFINLFEHYEYGWYEIERKFYKSLKEISLQTKNNIDTDAIKCFVRYRYINRNKLNIYILPELDISCE
jgi:hypothetical protein